MEKIAKILNAKNLATLIKELPFYTANTPRFNKYIYFAVVVPAAGNNGVLRWAFLH